MIRAIGARNWTFAAAVCSLAFAANAAGMEDRKEPASSDKPPMRFNIPTWTLGGKQLWTDEFLHGQWRIQRHVMISGHYRLLDPDNIRRAWGPWETCWQTWTRLKVEKNVEPLQKQVVIVLHGLGRSRSSMKSISEFLAKNSDFSVMTYSYASTRTSLANDAQGLAKVVSRLEGVEKVHFVAHSMGNLVVRHMLGDQMVEARGFGVDHRLGRVVMLAPPNNGAALAQRFQNNPVFKVVFGNGGRQFTKDWEEIQKRLVTPPCQFGVIAGGAKDGEGRNPLLEGDDDMVVTVEETRLPGAHDFAVLPVAHTFIMDNKTVQEYTLRFLQHGFFIAQDRRQPIEKK